MEKHLLERVNEEIKCSTRVVGIFPSEAAITPLVVAVLLEQDEHWQLEGRRMFSSESVSTIPSLEGCLRSPRYNNKQPKVQFSTQAPGFTPR